ncbi:hypothetical protein OB934_22435 [Aeromonas salmonicida]|uniref:hypothetical protein n=1 Tax=Aeromonas salmonicida TaxID=645 RepID=UPI00259F67CD|nr:hypothetical protein [Aeromonas salmonicida]MDM5065516.1 hypothetical protein [Aeromonas salmonicida]
MHTLSLSGRRMQSGSHQNDADHPASPGDEQRQFETLMARPPVTAPRRAADAGDGRASGTAVPLPAAGDSDVMDGLPAQFRRANLRFSRMHWRITNGPLAGMSIEASSDETGLHIHLRDGDVARLQRAFGAPETLADVLSARLNRPVTLEVSYAASPTE